MEEELKKQIKVLETRIDRLEKIESRRNTTKLIKILIKIIVIIAIVIGLWQGYNYVNKTYIKPYKEMIDELKEGYDSIKDNNIINKYFNKEDKKDN